jgi:hypothetical protein
MRSFVPVAALALSVCCMLFVSSCDESLPPRSDPQDYLVGSISFDYYYSRSGDVVYATIKIKNTYPEVLSDTATIYGELDIDWKDNPIFHRHVTLSTDDIKKFYFNPITGLTEVATATYASGSKILTMPEGSEIVLQYSWNLINDDTLNLRQMVSYHQDSVNPSLFTTGVLTFNVTAGVHLYKKASMVYAPTLMAKLQLTSIR